MSCMYTITITTHDHRRRTQGVGGPCPPPTLFSPQSRRGSNIIDSVGDQYRDLVYTAMSANVQVYTCYCQHNFNRHLLAVLHVAWMLHASCCTVSNADHPTRLAASSADVDIAALSIMIDKISPTKEFPLSKKRIRHNDCPNAKLSAMLVRQVALAPLL